jgi:hypothetical protein
MAIQPAAHLEGELGAEAQAYAATMRMSLVEIVVATPAAHQIDRRLWLAGAAPTSRLSTLCHNRGAKWC